MGCVSLSLFRCQQAWCFMLACLILLLPGLQPVTAYDLVHVDVSNDPYYQALRQRHEIVFDQTQWFQRRQAMNDTSQDNNSTLPSAPSTLNTPTGLPEPFDSLSSNFTSSSCPAYFNKFLADSTFQSCLPVSLLLQNSVSFFQAVRSQALLVQTLNTACSASLAVCSPYMEKLADGLNDPANCAADYQNQNPVVMQAYAGLKAYEPLYTATCLKDSTTNQYCFAEAMDASTADDSYPYYTAIGLQLPSTTEAKCSTCLKQTMDIFAKYAAQPDQPLANTYVPCATQIDSHCGDSFANTQVKTASKVKNRGARSSQLSMLSMILGIACLWNVL